MSKVLLFGGSFNPVHHGHLLTARDVAERLHFSEVIFIPCAPHKRGEYAPFRDRAAMVRLAIREQECRVRFDISELEAGIEGRPSYTIDTVEAFRRSGFKNVYWLVGSDNLPKIVRWHRFDELKELTKFVVMDRPGYPIDNELLSLIRADVCPAPQLAISSSEIRHRIKSGRSISYLTPHSVQQYIRQHKLYI